MTGTRVRLDVSCEVVISDPEDDARIREAIRRFLMAVECCPEPKPEVRAVEVVAS